MNDMMIFVLYEKGKEPLILALFLRNFILKKRSFNYDIIHT